LVGTALLAGCGTIMHGARQNVYVGSTPAGAKIDISPAEGTFTTPATLNLERKHSYVLTFNAPGYNSASLNIHNDIGAGTVVADVLLGLLGVVVDAVTGAWYGLSPETSNVTLSRAGGSEDDAIHISVGKLNDVGGFKVSADAPNVSVMIQQK
jgi:hypothetical protein